MGWPLAFRPGLNVPNELRQQGRWPPPPGTAYWAPWVLARPDIFCPRPLGARYRAVQERRAPLVIWLPGGDAWLPDMVPRDGDPDGWELVPAAPAAGQDGAAWCGGLSAFPSIHAVGSYHGHLLQGVLQDDCEGRRYTAAGVVAGAREARAGPRAIGSGERGGRVRENVGAGHADPRPGTSLWRPPVTDADVLTSDERDECLILAASRGAFVACVQPGKTLAQAARAFGYTSSTVEGDAFETAFEWARENLENDRVSKEQARAARDHAERLRGSA